MEEVLSRTQTPTKNVSNVTSAESTESKLEVLHTEFKELRTILHAQAAQEPAGEVYAVASKLYPPPPSLPAKKLLIVDPPCEAGAEPVEEVTPITVRHEPPIPSLVSIVVGWATLLASAPPF